MISVSKGGAGGWGRYVGCVWVGANGAVSVYYVFVVCDGDGWNVVVARRARPEVSCDWRPTAAGVYNTRTGPLPL